MKTLAIILAGGQGLRLGGIDKGLLPYAGSTLIETILAVISPQVDQTVISCNRNLEQYQQFGYPIITDTLSGYQGPLAGIAAALSGKQQCDVAITLPCDSPNPPEDLALKLGSQLADDNYDLCYAWDGNRDQYLFSAMHYRCRAQLEDYLARGGRSVKGFHQRLRCKRVDFSSQPQRFININAPADLP
ncbi:molybdenum cofactor guanylyltransferase MobA [Candidatus Litorirhabdus singularis]|nr:molybdenum cofactor guanylyltransferase MobA [Candidatus Litorirhabdus singularis]